MALEVERQVATACPLPLCARFDQFHVDLKGGILQRSGFRVPVQSQPFQVLRLLLEAKGNVVTRDELRRVLWPENTFVDFELGVNTAVKKLRQALADPADHPKFIETLPRIGYRFLAPVEWVTENGKGVEKAGNSATAGGMGVASERTASGFSSTGTSRWLAVGGAILLAVGCIGVWKLVQNRRAHALSEADTVVLADFSNSTGDPVFDDTLKQALSVSLRQSPFLNVLSDEKVSTTLRLMTRPANTPLTPEIAREACQRAGSKAYIAGSVASIGSEYVLGLKAVNCQSGDTLSMRQVQAVRKEKVLDALGSAAVKLRTELGESLSSVQRFDTPIEQATTPSFDALKAFSLGSKNWHENGETKAIPFFKEAIDLDPNFAMAYAYLGLVYGILGEESMSIESLNTAFQLRDRVTESEKFLISSLYYVLVTGELEKNIQLSELWTQTYPRDYLSRLSLGSAYATLGQYERSATETRKSLGLNPDDSLIYSNLMLCYAMLNRLDEASATYEEAMKHGSDYRGLHEYMYGVAFLKHDDKEMEQQASWARDKPGAADVLLASQADTEAFSGRLRKARELSQRAVESAQQNGQKETAALWQMIDALREAEFGNSARAVEQTSSALNMGSTRDVRIRAALALSRAGDSKRAERVADELQKHFPLDTLINDYWLPTIRATVEINRSNPSKAIEFLKAAVPYELGSVSAFEFGVPLYPAYVRGQAYLILHQGAEAATEFQKFLDHPTMVANNPLFSLAHLGLARAYALQSHTDKSRTAYQDFFTLWKDADADIPILKQARVEFAKLP